VSRKAARWEKAVQHYATGEHASGRDLELVVELAAATGGERVLDVGAGAGHTARRLAPRVATVVVTDPVEGMLAAAKRLFESDGLDNTEFRLARAESLPFADADFDIVTSRLAAHHFEEVPAAMREIARVLKPGGVFIFIDTIAPVDDEAARFQHEVEMLRDPTHARIYTQAAWVGFAEAAGLRTQRIEVVPKEHAFESWLQRGGEDAETMEAVRQRFLQAPASAVRTLDIQVADGQVIAFTDQKLVLAARR
jgi:ubiquinone/menaquinone biosynthesis C-methylase UbiE